MDILTVEAAAREAIQDERFARASIEFSTPGTPYYGTPEGTLDRTLWAIANSSPDHAAACARWSHRAWFRLRVAEAVSARVVGRGLRALDRVRQDEASRIAEEPMRQCFYSPMGWRTFGQWTSARAMDRETRARIEQDRSGRHGGASIVTGQ